ncbi:HEAT repeat domain-containing protein [Candidatus Poribacteria bacterium]|nr:HEAT repeat domain-containing protein [Candidatus Poribacteria bacterium]
MKEKGLSSKEVERLSAILRNEAASTRERLLAIRALSTIDSPHVLANILLVASSQNKRLAQEGAELIRKLDQASLFKLLDHMLLNREEIGYFGQKMFEVLYKLREQDVLKYIVINAIKNGEEWGEKRRTLSQWMRNLGLIEKYVDLLGELPVELAKSLGKILKKVDDRVVLDIARSAKGIKGINKEKSVKLLDVLYDVADNEGIAPILVNLLSSDDQRIRSKTALILGKLSDNLHFFHNALKDPDPRVRANAVEGLWGLDNPKARDIYLEALGDENNRVRANAAKGLYEMGDPRGLQVLKEMIDDHDGMMRASSAWVLGEMGDTSMIGKLESMAAGDPAEIARRNAIRAIEKILTKKVVPTLRDLIRFMNKIDPDAVSNPLRFFRRIAALRSIRSEMLVEVLSAAPPVDSPIVRRKLIESIAGGLEDMADDGLLLLALMSAIRFDKMSFWSRIIEGIQAMIQRPEDRLTILSGGVETMPDMLLATLKEGMPSTAAPIAEILRWEDEAIIERLKPLLDDSNPLVRSLAAETIGLLGRFETLDRLEEMARSDPDPSVREKALKAIERLKTTAEITSTLPDELHMRILHLSLENLPEISISVSLMDGNSNSIDTLREEEIHLFENGRPIDCRFERLGEEMPVYVVILMDYSLSMSDEDIYRMEEAVSEFISSVKGEDRIAILKFASEIYVPQPLNKVDRLRHDPIRGGFKGDRDGTMLYDALDRAISILNELEGIKLAIVLTDGEDSGSTKTAKDVIHNALKNGISIHAIALGDEVDEGTLRNLAISTGGALYATGDPGELGKIYREISSSLQSHYRLSYRSWAWDNEVQNAFLIIRADLGPLTPEAWTKVILRNG